MFCISSTVLSIKELPFISSICNVSDIEYAHTGLSGHAIFIIIFFFNCSKSRFDSSTSSVSSSIAGLALLTFSLTVSFGNVNNFFISSILLPRFLSFTFFSFFSASLIFSHTSYCVSLLSSFLLILVYSNRYNFPILFHKLELSVQG